MCVGVGAWGCVGVWGRGGPAGGYPYPPTHLHPPEGEEDEVAHDHTQAPQRQQVHVPVPGVVWQRLEAAQEGVVCGSGGVVVAVVVVVCVWGGDGGEGKLGWAAGRHGTKRRAPAARTGKESLGV